MVLEIIRLETKSAHQELEKLIVPQIKSIKSKDDYIEVLKLFYGYFKPVEDRLDKYLSDTDVPGYSQRRKSSSILSDIAALGEGISMPVCNDIPEINSKEEAWGAMYVLEGSTLGGQIISNMIKKVLVMNDDSSLSFFKGYGNESEQMWKSFTETLNNSTTGDKQDITVGTAKETFIKFKNWVQNN
jgi:heme oxygenase